MSRSPPLRFLAVVLGGWAAVRTAIVAPPWSAPPADAAAARPSSASVAPAAPREVRSNPPPAVAAPVHSAAAVRASPRAKPASRPQPGLAERLPTAAPAANAGWRLVENRGAPDPPPSPPGFAEPQSAPAQAPAGRWSLSAWSFLRRGEEAALAAGGLLGGSQAGARVTYRLNRDRARPLALSVRLSAPLRRAAGAEAALGLDWRASPRLPVHLLLERRQALGREGRSALGLTAYGAIGDARLGRFRIDAYAQAGIVGARSLDPFGDGSVRLSLPLRRGRVGVGAWGGAQPGAARLDLGPQATLRLPVAGRAVTIAADWRVRVAGNAEPGSGPTLTLATDF